MTHSVEMWLERGEERRLVHIELDVDMSAYPHRLVARSFRAWLSDDWVEIQLTDEEMVKSVRLTKTLIEQKDNQSSIVDQGYKQ